MCYSGKNSLYPRRSYQGQRYQYHYGHLALFCKLHDKMGNNYLWNKLTPRQNWWRRDKEFSWLKIVAGKSRPGVCFWHNVSSWIKNGTGQYYGKRILFCLYYISFPKWPKFSIIIKKGSGETNRRRFVVQCIVCIAS